MRMYQPATASAQVPGGAGGERLLDLIVPVSKRAWSSHEAPAYIAFVSVAIRSVIQVKIYTAKAEGL